eukprot:gene11225-2038_t
MAPTPVPAMFRCKLADAWGTLSGLVHPDIPAFAWNSPSPSGLIPVDICGRDGPLPASGHVPCAQLSGDLRKPGVLVKPCIANSRTSACHVPSGHLYGAAASRSPYLLPTFWSLQVLPPTPPSVPGRALLQVPPPPSAGSLSYPQSQIRWPSISSRASSSTSEASVLDPLYLPDTCTSGSLSQSSSTSLDSLYLPAEPLSSGFKALPGTNSSSDGIQ